MKIKDIINSWLKGCYYVMLRISEHKYIYIRDETHGVITHNIKRVENASKSDIPTFRSRRGAERFASDAQRVAESLHPYKEVSVEVRNIREDYKE